MVEAITFSTIIIPLLLTTLAGLSTGIGSAIAYMMKKPNLSYLSFFMGFSGGVMIYISFVELLPSACEVIGQWWAVLGFFAGMMLTGAIDMIVPENENPHASASSAVCKMSSAKRHLMHVGIFTAIAIGLHNLPEGLAAFTLAYSDMGLGLIIALAIAIHNIPEGIAVSVPIFCATGDRKKAFKYSFLSGVSEPVGGLMGFLLLAPFLSEWLISFLMVFVAGIMVYISVDKILPAASNYNRGHTMIVGLVLGMMIMALSILLM